MNVPQSPEAERGRPTVNSPAPHSGSDQVRFRNAAELQSSEVMHANNSPGRLLAAVTAAIQTPPFLRFLHSGMCELTLAEGKQTHTDTHPTTTTDRTLPSIQHTDFTSQRSCMSNSSSSNPFRLKEHLSPQRRRRWRTAEAEECLHL